MAELKSRLFSWYLTKYLIREVFISFFVGTGIFLLILLSFQAIRLSEFIIMRQVSLWDVMRLSFYLVQSFVPIAVPIAFLFAVLLGISRANSDGELLGLQVNGIGIWQIFSPILIFSILLTFFCLYTSMYSVPRGNRGFELLVTKLGAKSVIATFKPGVFQNQFYGMVFYAETLSSSQNRIERVFLFDERDREHPHAITAQSATLRADPSQGMMTLRLIDGAIHVDKRQVEAVQQKINFDVYDINLAFSSGKDASRAYSLPSLDYPQLRERLSQTRKDIRSYKELQVELHRRFSLSFSCVVFAALGFFISIMSRRGIRSSAIVLCLLVGVVYWLSYLMANALALHGWVLPWLGIWTPNVVFAIVPYFCYRRFRHG